MEVMLLLPITQVWCTNSQLAVDHVLGGSFESAMRVSLSFILVFAIGKPQSDCCCTCKFTHTYSKVNNSRVATEQKLESLLLK